MLGNEYQRLAMRTDDGKSSERLQNKLSNVDDKNIGLMLEASLGLSGEVGELNDMIKKWIFHEKEMDWEHFEKEIGDICWYIAAMCKSVNIDLEKVMQMNIDKLIARYPDGFDVSRANNRSKEDV